jgi:hypothetical protein
MKNELAMTMDCQREEAQPRTVESPVILNASVTLRRLCPVDIKRVITSVITSERE